MVKKSDKYTGKNTSKNIKKYHLFDSKKRQNAQKLKIIAKLFAYMKKKL